MFNFAQYAHRELLLLFISFSPHLSYSLRCFVPTTTLSQWMKWMKEKNLFLVYICDCVYISCLFIQHNFFLYFLSTFLFSTYFTVQFSSSDRAHARARRDFATCEKSLDFCFIYFFEKHIFVPLASERQQFHRNFGSFSSNSFSFYCSFLYFYDFCERRLCKI